MKFVNLIWWIGIKFRVIFEFLEWSEDWYFLLVSNFCWGVLSMSVLLSCIVLWIFLVMILENIIVKDFVFFLVWVNFLVVKENLIYWMCDIMYVLSSLYIFLIFLGMLRYLFKLIMLFNIGVKVFMGVFVFLNFDFFGVILFLNV